jgi:ubiquinone/menaquinone biosynthesis C-methylase UbiE
MKRSPEELAQTERFEQKYKNSQSGVMLSIERQVCGCDYGGNSWTTRGQAQNIESLLGLKPGFRFLDLGAGSGWPGLYLAKSSGCDLRIACANATRLPFRNSCFDAISHSDLLCCLKQKRDVLESCSRVLRKGGRMVFTVISMAANLSQAERENTLATAPEYVESGIDYLTMLEQSGWSVIDNQDLSAAYAASCHRQVKAMKENKDDYIAINGASDYGDRLTRYASKFSALEEGRLRRELFVAKTI